MTLLPLLFLAVGATFLAGSVAQFVEPCSECSIASVENCNCDLQDGGGGGELQTGDLVIVVIGGDDGSDGALRTVELIDIEPPAGAGQSCSNLPFGAYRLFAFHDGEGRPVTCGGYYKPNPQQCHTNVNGAWLPLFTTLEDRGDGGSAAQLADGRAFVFGGETSSTYSTSEIFDPDLGSFLPGPQLPHRSRWSCGIEIPSQPGVVFIAGSYEDSAAYLLDIDTGTVIQETGFNTRAYVACGAVESPLGGYDIVVAGGTYDETAVDVLNLDTMTWRPGTPLPVGLISPSSMPVDPESFSSFLIIGGRSSSLVFSSDVYEYNGLSEEWTLRPELGLYEGKYRFATTFAKRDNLGCYD